MSAAVADLGIERLVHLDERIDAHEGEALRDRWEFGHHEPGRAADNSGQHPVSSAPAGESESRERLDRPAAYPKAHPRRPIPWPFGEFHAAIRG